MTTPIKLELGGGTNPKDGFVNVANRSYGGARVDHFLDLEQLWGEWQPRPLDQFPQPMGYNLPFEPETVSEVFTAHCLEHVANLDGVLWELGRVCHNGATITIHVPHWNSPEARCPSHKHVITEKVVKGWTQQEWCGKRFDLVTVKHVADPALFDEAKELFPAWKDEQIIKFVPGVGFETRFVLRVRRAS